jgi:hypothetical protein
VLLDLLGHPLDRATHHAEYDPVDETTRLDLRCEQRLNTAKSRQVVTGECLVIAHVVSPSLRARRTSYQRAHASIAITPLAKPEINGTGNAATSPTMLTTTPQITAPTRINAGISHRGGRRFTAASLICAATRWI